MGGLFFTYRRLVLMRIVTFDPGHMTGYALFEDGQLRDSGEFSYLEDPGLHILSLWLHRNTAHIDLVIIEKFALYAWKAQHKSWDTFPEVEVIGVIKYLCRRNSIRFIEQLPSQKDMFTNKYIDTFIGKEKQVSSRHAYDAIRHGLVYYTVGDGKELGYAQDIFRSVKGKNS